MKRMKIYLSGPITGHPEDETRKKFEIAENLLRNKGFDPTNPLKLEHAGREDYTWNEFLAHDIRHLVFCEAIYMIAGWKNSRGARLELTIARGLGMELYFEEALDKTYYHYSL